MRAPEALILDLLASLEKGPRPYAEIMEAWRTNCPRLPVWEDVVEEGLVKQVGSMVKITDAGRTKIKRNSSLRPRT